MDLGASVNLLPYSVYVDLGLGELEPTNITLQLADHSVKIPRGIVKDVLVQVDKFYFPVDFVVLDTQLVVNQGTQFPVILGRPFLAAANAIIHCKGGLMTLSFGNMTVNLNIFNVIKGMGDEEDVCEANMVDSVVQKYLGAKETFLVIISSSLEMDQENQLLEILRTHITTLGWTIADIKGISLLICTHRIHLEEDVKPSRQPQR